MSFADRLKQVMREKNMSQAELSVLTGIGKSSISQYLSGKNEPKAKTTQKIAEALQISAAWLIEEAVVNNSEIEKCISIEKAAGLMGKSKLFVRAGIINGNLPFGYAVKLSSRYSYHISPKLFYEYMGQ